jgi:hypothetical protein
MLRCGTVTGHQTNDSSADGGVVVCSAREMIGIYPAQRPTASYCQQQYSNVSGSLSYTYYQGMLLERALLIIGECKLPMTLRIERDAHQLHPASLVQKTLSLLTIATHSIFELWGINSFFCRWGAGFLLFS